MGRIRLHRGRLPCALIALCFFGAGSAWAQSEAERIGITVPSIATSLPQYGDPYGCDYYCASWTYGQFYGHDIHWCGDTGGGLCCISYD